MSHSSNAWWASIYSRSLLIFLDSLYHWSGSICFPYLGYFIHFSSPFTLLVIFSRHFYLIYKSTVSLIVSDSHCLLSAWHPRAFIICVPAHSTSVTAFRKTRVLFEVLDGLKPTVSTELVLNSLESSCLCSLRVEITGACDQSQFSRQSI